MNLTFEFNLKESDFKVISDLINEVQTLKTQIKILRRELKK